MRDHIKLEVFRIADRLALEVYRATRHFPDDERFGLCSQLRRAAVSIPTNIVEGAARQSELEYARLLGIAYSSAKELHYELSLCARLGYLDRHESERLASQATITCKSLWSLIRTIDRRRSLASGRSPWPVAR